MNIEQARFNMIEQQIRPWDVLDPAVLSLLAVVQARGLRAAAYRALAFVDTEVPLPGGPVHAGAARRGAPAAGAERCTSTSACSRSAPARATWPRCWRTARST